MVAKKVLALVIMTTALVITGCQAKDENVTTIGINQLIAHEALDASREGFLEVLKENGYTEGENLEIDYKNAQGEGPTALAIAQEFSEEKKDLVFAIGTGSAQASYNANKEIPILITAVTDPVDAGIVESFEKPETNVTGTSDGVPIEPQLELMKKIFPDLKTIGVIYTTAEPNSEYQVRKLREATAKLGLTLKEVGIDTLNDVGSVLPSMLEEIEVLYTPTDNKVASAYALIVKLANDKNIPVFCAEDAGVTVGGLISAGLDYHTLGRETGEMAVQVLKGTLPKDLAVKTQQKPVIVVNAEVAKAFGITIPQEVLDEAKVLGGN